MTSPKGRNNASLALSLGAVALGMVLLAYASVPLYRLFCETTGFAGTTRRGATASTQVVDRPITIRFNADIAPGLAWEFAPETPQMTVKLGENSLAHYRAHNLAASPTAGHATYNVLPEQAGSYFVKIECFCFTNQTLEANQVVNMPISFYIDPAIAQDPELKNVSTITLSYTFFPAKSDAATP